MSQKDIIDYKDVEIVLVHAGSDSQETMNNSEFQLEKEITRIVDWHLMPLICIFYFMDYLDRANMGNARLVYFIRKRMIDTKKTVA